MHQLSIICQSKQVKGNWWMFSNFWSLLGPVSPAPNPPIISGPRKTACLSDKQPRTCRLRWAADAGDKRQLLMNRLIWWLEQAIMNSLIVLIVGPHRTAPQDQHGRSWHQSISAFVLINWSSRSLENDTNMWITAFNSPQQCPETCSFCPNGNQKDQ